MEHARAPRRPMTVSRMTDVVVVMVVVMVATLMVSTTTTSGQQIMTTVPPPSEGVQVRVVNGTSSGKYLSGRVEVLSAGNSWKPLLVSRVAGDVPGAICRSKGFSKVKTFLNNMYGHGSNGTHPDTLQCTYRSGNATLSECLMVPTGYTYHPANHVLTVLCYNNTEDVLTLRLANGDSTGVIAVGRLELQLADQGWGAVCNWAGDQRTADILCQYMGFQHGESLRLSNQGNYSHDFLLDMVYCYQTADPMSCQFNFMDPAFCRGESLTGLRCVNASVRLKTTQPDVLNAGNVEVYVEGMGWNEICQDGWDDMDARVVCRELGFQDGKALCCNQLGGDQWGSMSISSVFTNFNCTGDEASLQNCTLNRMGASQSCSFDSNSVNELASVLCYTTPLAQVDNVFAARLIHGDRTTTDEGWGSVQVRRFGFWGSVCPEHFFTHAEASVACRMVGFKGGKAHGRFTATHEEITWPHFKPSKPRRPVWITEITCNGTEASLEDCDILRWGTPKTECERGSGVICYHNELELRLSSTDNMYGRLDVVLDGVKGTVCGDDFVDHEAEVACRTLGYSTGFVLKEPVARGSGPVYMSAVACRHEDDDLFQCVGAWKNSTQQCKLHNTDAKVSCFNDIMLHPGTHRSGVVVDNRDRNQMLFCGKNFDDVSAKVVCREIGFRDGLALPPGIYGRLSSYLTLTQINCSGNESTILDCPVVDNMDQTCYSPEYASVSCFNKKEEQEKYQLDLAPEYGSQGAGRLTVFYKQTSGYVCSDGWSDNAANVFCRMKSYKGGVSLLYEGYSGGPFFVSDTNCTGNETSLDDCSSRDRYGCSSNQAAGVLCYRTSPPKVTLTQDGDIPLRGRVTISVDGEEGRICGAGWSPADAKTACLSLGYHDGVPVLFPKSDKPVFMSEVGCGVSDRNLFQCNNYGWRRPLEADCTRPNATEAGVVCFDKVRLLKGEITNRTINGVLSVLNDHSEWREICSGMSVQTVTVACRGMGFTNGSLLKPTRSYYSYGSRSELQCDGPEISVDNCTLPSRSCSSLTNLMCYNSSASDEWTWSIEKGYTGAVKVTHQGITGVVCEAGWTPSAASTLCRSKGFKGGIVLGGKYNRTQGAMLVWMSNVTCPPDATNMSQCLMNTTVGDSCRRGKADTYTASVLCYKKSAPVVRLVNGSTPAEGLVQIEYDGVNGTVCPNQWSRYDARALCIQLGYRDGISTTTHNGYNRVPSTDPVYIGGFSCASSGWGSENLFQCHNDGWNSTSYSCRDHNHGEAKAVCYATVRLEGSERFIGPVSLYTGYTYSLVCADGFDDHAARVVCRNLGFQTGAALYPRAFGYQSLNVGVDEVRCSGDELKFEDCDMRVSSNTCSDRLNYASVVCSDDDDDAEAYSIDLQHGDHGAVQVHHLGYTGYVCATHFDDREAQVVCREAGYLTGISYPVYGTGTGTGGDLFWLSNLNCSGSEPRLDRCLTGSRGFNFGKSSVIPTCNRAGAFCANSYDQTAVSIRLMDGNDTRTTSGRVEVYVNGTWGYVCATYNRRAADVVCKQRGYASGDMIPNSFGRSNGSQVMNIVGCLGNETSVFQCPISFGSETTWCPNHMAVQCHGGVRLTGHTPGQETLSGHLEALITPGNWNAVCASGMTNHTADLVCKDLGHTSALYQEFIYRPWLDSANVSCPTSVSKFGDCSVTSSNVPCPGFMHVSVYCFDSVSPKEFLGVTMFNSAGIPSATRYGFGGAICGQNFGDPEADVVCRQGGFQRGVALRAVPKTPDWLPYVLTGLSCNGSESDVRQCRRGAFVHAATDCPDATVPSVLCSQTVDPIEFRINPSTGGQGRAEVKLNGEWRLIDRYGFGYSEATVFCKSVGFSSGITQSGITIALPDAEVAVGSVDCTGSEDSLLQCQGNWTQSAHEFKPASYGVQVLCYKSVKLTRGSSGNNGMVHFKKHGSWGPVCAENFNDKDAGVVCRELGYDRGLSLCCAPYGATFESYVLSGVRCAGNETSLDQCPASTDVNDLRTCNYRDYAAVVCSYRNETGNYSLAFGGESEFTGPVQVEYLNTKGRICNDSWDDKDARVACREMGYEDGQAYSHFKSSFSYFDYDGPYWSSEFECRGDEMRLGDCPHIVFGNVTTCVSQHFAGAICFNNNSIAYRMAGLVNDAAFNTGRVEVRVDGRWGAVCDHYWDRKDAAVFCRSQGYSDGDTTSFGATELAALTGPTWTAKLRCRGPETELNKCPHEGWQEEESYYCREHRNDAGVFCYQNVRLSTGPGQEVGHGAVQLYRDDAWYLLCDDDFDDVTARAVCRELGYFDGKAVCCSAYDPVFLPLKVRDDVKMHCSGDEESLGQCLHNITTCTSQSYASVICLTEDDSFSDDKYAISRAPDSETAGTGRLEVEHYGVKGRICAGNWTDLDAAVYCRAQNYTSGFAYQHSHANEYPDEEDVGPFFLSNFNCTGDEKDLMSCSHSDRLSLGNCSTGHSAAVVCYRESGIEYRLSNKGSNQGRVEMAIDNKWGTICDQRWDVLDAEVICKYLNFSSGIPQRTSKYGEGTGPVWLREVQCTGSEAALHQCPHTGFTEQLPSGGQWWFYRPPCETHQDDAAVFCYKNVRISSTKTDSSMGGLEMYRHSEWMTVCDAGFSNVEATVACKSLMGGFSYGVAIAGSAFGVVDSPPGISSVSCSGGEADIADCTVSETGGCSSGHYASIACSNTTIEQAGYLMRIAKDSYSSPRFGIVEIRDNGIWKRVCHRGWDDTDASVACKELGFKGGASYTHIYKHLGPIGSRDYSCSGEEASLQECPRQTTPDLNGCGYNDYDAGIICYNTTGLHYSLSGGNSSSTGRVEITYDGQVGAVCSLHWTYNDSRVLCRSLGYSDGIPVAAPADLPWAMSHYFLNAPFCKGDEISLLDCLNSGFNSSYLAHSCVGEAWATCFNQSVDIADTRLILKNGTEGTNEGRVEIFVSGPNAWGTVCDDFWDDFDASVVCASLGYQWGEAIVNRTHGTGTGRIWLDNVECQGDETSLAQCRHRGFGTHNCRHSEDAGVFCHNTPKPTLPPTTTTTSTTTTRPPTTPSTSTTTQTTRRPATTPATTRKPTTPQPTTKTIPTTTTTSTTTTTTTTTPTPTTRKPLTRPPPRTPRPTPPPTTAPPSPTTSTKTSTTGHSEHGVPQAKSHSSAQTTPIAVGVSLSVLVIVIVAVVLFVLVKRRRLCNKSGVPHQRFSDEVIGVTPDGSIAMHNQMFDAADPGNGPMGGGGGGDSSKYMPGDGEITLGGEHAVYNSSSPSASNGNHQPLQRESGGGVESGFANPLYSVMQPFPQDTSPLHPDQLNKGKKNSNSGTDA